MSVSSGMPYRDGVRVLRTVLAASLVLAVLLAPPARAETATVTATVRGETAFEPLADLEVTVWRLVGLGEGWQEVSTVTTDADGRLSLDLPAGEVHTLSFAERDPYPAQFLGGAAAPAAHPDSLDWESTTFVPGERDLPATLRLLTSHLHSVAGLAVGDEDVAPLGWALLYERESGDLVADVPLDADGGFAFHRLRAGHEYTVRVDAEGYLPTYLGGSSFPQLATWFVPGFTSLGEAELVRGASVGGAVTHDGTGVDEVLVQPYAWDRDGETWIEAPTRSLTHAGTWSVALAPGFTYTLYFDAEAIEAPLSQYLGGGTEPPDPKDPTATFELHPSGTEVAVELLRPLENLAPPRVSGTAQVGTTLTVEPGSWAPEPEKRSYRWLRDGTPVATGTRYVLGAADAGARITVEELVARPYHLRARATSAPVGKVARAGARLALTVSPSSPRHDTALTVTATVTAAAGQADGRLTLYVDGKKRGTASPSVSGRKATARFTVPKGLTAGKHRLEVRAARSASVEAASARTTVAVAKGRLRLSVSAPKNVATGSSPKVTVQLVTSGPKPRGTLKVRFGSTTRTVTLTGRKTKVSVTGPKIGRRTTVTVRFTPRKGTYATPKAVSRTVRVR